MSAGWTASSHGIDWQLELDRAGLLPGRLVAGRVTLTAGHDVEARGLLVTLRGDEHWQHEETTTDAQGHMRTETRTSHAAMPAVPVLLAAPVRLARGETQVHAFELPVPGLGPASLDATVAGLAWSVEAKLDVASGFDSAIVAPVRILQPVALLRAGVVQVGAFALYEAADAQAGGVSGSIELDPMPLCPRSPFTGKLQLHVTQPMRVRGIRAELRVQVKATVASGCSETVVPWAAAIAGEMELTADHSFAFRSEIADCALPTVELPHGRADAQVHVILDRSWARDPHLVRDVTMATTLEL